VLLSSATIRITLRRTRPPLLSLFSPPVTPPLPVASSGAPPRAASQSLRPPRPPSVVIGPFPAALLSFCRRSPLCAVLSACTFFFYCACTHGLTAAVFSSSVHITTSSLIRAASRRCRRPPLPPPLPFLVSASLVVCRVVRHSLSTLSFSHHHCEAARRTTTDRQTDSGGGCGCASVIRHHSKRKEKKQRPKKIRCGRCTPPAAAAVSGGLESAVKEGGHSATGRTEQRATDRQLHRRLLSLACVCRLSTAAEPWLSDRSAAERPPPGQRAARCLSPLDSQARAGKETGEARERRRRGGGTAAAAPPSPDPISEIARRS